MLVLRLAWRNAWRNARRTAVVVTAVAVGISGTLLSVAFNYGMIVEMVETAITTDLGHLQIHAAGHDANPDLHVHLQRDAARAVDALRELPGVRAFARRVRGEGLVASPRASAGVRVVGVEPEREAGITRVADSIVEGSYLDGGARQVVVGEALARRLEVGVGDKLVLSVQDLSGDLAAEALRVEGVFRTPSRPLDRGTVFVGIGEGQSLLGLGRGVTEVVVLAEERGRIASLRGALDDELEGAEVRTWEELQPVLVYLVDMFDQSAVLVYAAIFVAMAFGIANVLLMTVYERTREIGVMRAIGFGRGRLVATVVAEALVVTLVGLVLGFALAVAGAAWLADGIDLSSYAEGLNAWGVGTRIRPVLRVEDFTAPTAVAIVTAVVASAWPAWRAVRLVPAEAVRQV